VGVYAAIATPGVSTYRTSWQIAIGDRGCGPARQTAAREAGRSCSRLPFAFRTRSSASSRPSKWSWPALVDTDCCGLGRAKGFFVPCLERGRCDWQGAECLRLGCRGIPDRRTPPAWPRGAVEPASGPAGRI